MPRVKRKLLLLALLYSGCAMASPPKLLPLPSHVAVHPGSFAVSPSVRIRVPPRDKGASEAAAYLSELLHASNGLQPKMMSAPGAMRFVRKAGFDREGYLVQSSRSGVVITASNDAGLLYGGITVWQLATGG